MLIQAGNISIPDNIALGWNPRQFPGLLGWFRSDLGVSLNQPSQPPQNMTAFTDVRRCTITQSGVDPFGASSSFQITEDNTAGNTHGLVFTPSSFVSADLATFVVYAKANSRRWLWLGDAAPGNAGASFDVLSGVLGTAVGGATSSIVAAGNGWFKCTVTGSFPNASWSAFMATADGAGATAYNGDGSSNLFLSTPSITQPKVSAWADQSGNGNHVTQAVAANQPLLVSNVLGGRPALQFNGTSHALASAIFAVAKPLQVFLVAKWNTVFAAQSSIFDGGNANHARFYRDAANRVNMIAGANLAAPGASETAFQAWTLTFNGVSSSLKQRGIVLASGDTGNNNTDGFTFGAIGGGGADWANCSIVEAIAYSQLVPDETRPLNYLIAEYGL